MPAYSRRRKPWRWLGVRIGGEGVRRNQVIFLEMQMEKEDGLWSEKFK